jgi:hypothetical protein
VQVHDDYADNQQYYDGGEEDEGNSRARVDENVDGPLVFVGGRGVNDQLRVRNDRSPSVGPLACLVDSNAEVLDIMIDLSEAEMYERKAQLIISAI